METASLFRDMLMHANTPARNAQCTPKHHQFIRFLTTAAMPRLNAEQRNQAIGRFHAGQWLMDIARDLNCPIRKQLRVQYNTTPTRQLTVPELHRQDHPQIQL